MRDREERPGARSAGGPANTPPFETEPEAVKSAADHQIPSSSREARGTEPAATETEQELERTRDMLAERTAPVVAEKTQEAITEAADRAMHDPELKAQVRRTAEAAQHDARRMAQDRLGEIGGRAENRINEGLGQAADRIEGMATRLESRADGMTEGATGTRARAGEMARTVADTMDSVARYLRENDVKGLRSDLERQVRERPLQTLLVGVAAGWITGKIMR